MKVQNNKEGDLTLFEKSLILVKVYCNCRDGTEDKEPGSAANGDNGWEASWGSKEGPRHLFLLLSSYDEEEVDISKEFIEMGILCDVY